MSAKPSLLRCMHGLEKHLWEAADNGAPDLRGILALRLLYADDLNLMSTSSEELQQQLSALASFCEQCQLAVNLSNTKVVVFVAQRSQYDLFFFEGMVKECHNEYRYLGSVFCAT